MMTTDTPHFDVVSVGDAWAAADVATGRELSIPGEWMDARTTATRLNDAAAHGHKALARALKAID